nr:PREDICTED: zona pellucida sperm-binding protein 3-like isoform X2 [Latimeria chalumnae]|eukprot:XP_014342257.1 PREDICTED: zona pellucida sperm-binding protein 3-like isoform X2 [Latimeria chalumnae]
MITILINFAGAHMAKAEPLRGWGGVSHLILAVISDLHHTERHVRVIKGGPETLTKPCLRVTEIVGVERFGTAACAATNTGHLVKASDLSLGPQKCSFIKEDGLGTVVLFEVELHNCGNVLKSQLRNRTLFKI